MWSDDQEEGGLRMWSGDQEESGLRMWDGQAADDDDGQEDSSADGESSLLGQIDRLLALTNVLPMPDDATRTPLDVWGLPDKMQGVPRNMSLYMRVRKWLPLAMSFPLRDGWTGYFIRVLFPIVIGLCVALRVSSLILNVMNVDVQVFESDTQQWDHRVVSFAFQFLYFF